MLNLNLEMRTYLKVPQHKPTNRPTTMEISFATVKVLPVMRAEHDVKIGGITGYKDNYL